MVFKSWISRKLTNKAVKLYDKHIGSRFTGAQQVMGVGILFGLYYTPSIYEHMMKTSKTLAPSVIKPYFTDRDYLERVEKLKEYVKDQRRAGNRVLSYDDKLMIYSEFLDLI